MDGGQGSTETKSTSAPWAVQQPYLTKGFQQASSLLGKSAAVSPNSYLQAGRNAVYGLGINAASNPLLTGAAQGAQQFASGANLGTDADPYFTAYMNNGGGQTPADEYLAATARGDMLNSNPYVDAMFDQAAGRVRASANSNASAAGRYGSGMHQDILDQGLNDLATNIYGQNYAQERQNQLAATGQIQGAYDTEQARRMGAASALQSGQLQGRGMQLSALQLLPNIYAAQLGGAQAAQGVGQDIQSQLVANKMEPWQRIANYMNTVGGNYGQTSVQQSPYYQPSPFSQILGAGLGIGSMFI